MNDLIIYLIIDLMIDLMTDLMVDLMIDLDWRFLKTLILFCLGQGGG